MRRATRGVGSIPWGEFATLNLLIRVPLFRMQQAAKAVSCSRIVCILNRFVLPTKFAAGGVVGVSQSATSSAASKQAGKQAGPTTLPQQGVHTVLRFSIASRQPRPSRTEWVLRWIPSGKACAAWPASQANQQWAGRRGKQGLLSSHWLHACEFEGWAQLCSD